MLEKVYWLDIGSACDESDDERFSTTARASRSVLRMLRFYPVSQEVAIDLTIENKFE